MHVLLQATFHKRRSYNGRNMQICRCQALPDPLPALACLTNIEMVWGRPEVTFRRGGKMLTKQRRISLRSSFFRPPQRRYGPMHAHLPDQPPLDELPKSQLANYIVVVRVWAFSFHYQRLYAEQIAAPRCKMGSDKVSSLWQRKNPCSWLEALRAQTLLLLIFVWSWRRLDNIHNTR